MNDLFDAVTLFLCTAITTGVVAVALTYSSFLKGREKATISWCWCMWMITVGLVLLALRGALPAWLAVGLGNALVLLGYGFAYRGCAIFRQVQRSPLLALLGVSVWLVAYFGFPAFHDDIGARIALASATIAFYSGLSAAEVWWGWREDRLPSYLSLFVLFFTHAAMHAIRSVLSFAFPDQEPGTLVSYGLTAISVENFIHAIGIAFFFFAVIKERVERKYRLAAEVDALTGAASRRFFVSETRDRLARKPNSGVLAIIDIDHFKSVNDCYGHLGGDRVLKSFGRFVSGRLEADMIFGRLGGEEFGIFLPDAEASQAREWLELLRSDLQALEILFMGSPIRITISIGAASVREAGLDFDHLMAAADGALYLAKDEGRNRLRMFNVAMRLHQISEDGANMRLGLAEQRLSRVNVRSRVGKA